MLRIVCFSLLSSMFQLFVAVSVVSAFAFLLTPCSSDRDGIFHFQDILFSSALACIVERVKLCHPKVRVMSQYGGQKRDLILEPVSGPISASLGGASIVSRCASKDHTYFGGQKAYAGSPSLDLHPLSDWICIKNCRVGFTSIEGWQNLFHGRKLSAGIPPNYELKALCQRCSRENKGGWREKQSNENRGTHDFDRHPSINAARGKPSATGLAQRWTPTAGSFGLGPSQRSAPGAAASVGAGSACTSTGGESNGNL